MCAKHLNKFVVIDDFVGEDEGKELIRELQMLGTIHSNAAYLDIEDIQKEVLSQIGGKKYDLMLFIESGGTDLLEIAEIEKHTKKTAVLPLSIHHQKKEHVTQDIPTTVHPKRILEVCTENKEAIESSKRIAIVEGDVGGTGTSLKRIEDIIAIVKRFNSSAKIDVIVGVATLHHTKHRDVLNTVGYFVIDITKLSDVAYRLLLPAIVKKKLKPAEKILVDDYRHRRLEVPFVRALGDGKFVCTTEKFFRDADSFREKTAEYALRDEIFEIPTPFAMLAAVDPWTNVFIKNEEYRKAMCKKGVLDSITKILKKDFTRAYDTQTKLLPDKIEEYMIVRDTIWGYYNEHFFEVIKDRIPKAGTILEIGCGTGTLCERIAREFPESKVVGIDSEPLAIKYAEEKHKRANITYLEGRLSKLSASLKKNYGEFDLCIAAMVPTTITPDSVLELVRDDGHFILSIAERLAELKRTYEIELSMKDSGVRVSQWLRDSTNYVLYMKKIGRLGK